MLPLVRTGIWPIDSKALSFPLGSLVACKLSERLRGSSDLLWVCVGKLSQLFPTVIPYQIYSRLSGSFESKQ